jgi:hypothetical protein
MTFNQGLKLQLNPLSTKSTINQGLTALPPKSFAQSYPQAIFLKQAF